MDTNALPIHVIACTDVVSLELAKRASLLFTSQLFKGLSLAACTEVAGRARSCVFSRNETLFMQGHHLLPLVMLESGCVKLTRLNANGSEIILALRGPSDAIDLPSGSPLGLHAFAARALTSSSALTWKWAAIENMVGAQQLNRNVSCILATYLNELEERYHEMSVDKVVRRLACAILRLARRFGNPTSAGVEVSISRQELAQMTGTTLFTDSRLVS